MGDGAPSPSGPEVAGAGVEAVQATAAPMEAAVETASQSLAGTIESMQQGQDGAGSILSSLADGSLEAQTPQPAAPEAAGEPEVTQDAVEPTAPTETITPEQQLTEPEQPQVTPEPTQETTDQIRAEDQATSEETATPEDAVTEATDLSTQVEALNNQVATVSEQMKELSNQQNELRDEVVDAMTKIPGLEDLLKALMEKAAPEQKQKMGALMILLQALLALGSSVIGGEKSGGAGAASEKKKDSPVVPTQPQPQPLAQPTS